MGLPYLVVRDITTLQLGKPFRLKQLKDGHGKKKTGMQKKKLRSEIKQFPSLFSIQINKIGFFHLKCIYLFNRKRKNPIKLNFVKKLKLKKNILRQHRRVCSTIQGNSHFKFFRLDWSSLIQLNTVGRVDRDRRSAHTVFQDYHFTITSLVCLFIYAFWPGLSYYPLIYGRLFLKIFLEKDFFFIIKNILIKDSIWTSEFEVCFVFILLQTLKINKREFS